MTKSGEKLIKAAKQAVDIVKRSERAYCTDCDSNTIVWSDTKRCIACGGGRTIEISKPDEH